MNKSRLFIKHIVRKAFLEDWLLKLVALAITAGLWLAVTGLSTPTTTRFTGVPLTMQILNNTDITNSPTGDVDIVVSGDTRRIGRINKSGLVASLDLTSMQPGERTITLSPANVFVDLPAGVKLDEIQPSKLQIKLEAIVEKMVPVKVETDGDPASGFEVYSRTVIPARVKVRGPQSVAATLDSVSTERIDITGHSADFVARGVAVVPTNTRAVVDDGTVDVAFKIGEKRVEKSYNLAVAGSTRHVTFTLYGPRTILAALKPESLKPTIVKDDTGTDQPQLTLPDDIASSVEIRNLRVK